VEVGGTRAPSSTLGAAARGMLSTGKMLHGPPPRQAQVTARTASSRLLVSIDVYASLHEFSVAPAHNMGAFGIRPHSKAPPKGPERWSRIAGWTGPERLPRSSRTPGLAPPGSTDARTDRVRPRGRDRDALHASTGAQPSLTPSRSCGPLLIGCAPRLAQRVFGDLEAAAEMPA
jgi:hypothetical protein